MGVRERREREREKARDAILAAARTLMREVGPQAMSLREIARRAEYSPATLYEYFKDKEDIFQALFREGFRRFGAALKTVPIDQPADQRLRGLGYAYVEFADANPEHYQVMFGQPVPGFCPSPEASAEADETFRILYQCIVDGVTEGTFRPMNETETLVAAVTIWSSIHGFVSLAHSGRFGANRGREGFLDLVLYNQAYGLMRVRPV